MQIGEFGLIERLTRHLRRGRHVILGVGDDCAAIKISMDFRLLLTTDMLIEGIHFRRDWMTPFEIGRKAMLVNLSDIAAMGGVPRYALVSVGLPKGMGLGGAADLFKGLRRTAEGEGVSIVGGDTNASPRLVVNVTLVGEVRGRVLTRSGARVGDDIWVTGTLGQSSLGLAALRRGRKKGYERYIRSHKTPSCRIEIGRILAKNLRVHSLIDLSDGLLGDLRHILEESRVGAEVHADQVPVLAGFTPAARALGLNPDRLKLAGGEDYELLFTASEGARLGRKILDVPVTKIGIIKPQRFGLKVVDSGGRSYQSGYTGFEHF